VLIDLHTCAVGSKRQQTCVQQPDGHRPALLKQHSRSRS